MGFLLQWLSVLDDPELVGLKDELEATGELKASSVIELFEYLVDLSPGLIGLYVDQRMSVLNTYLETIKSLSKSRLASGQAPDYEGSPALAVPGLLTP